MPGRSRLSMAEKRARNRSLTSMLWTPPAYPGYSSCLGSLTRTSETSGIISFVPYGEEDSPPPYEPDYIGPCSLPISRSLALSSSSPPLCSPEDDTEFQESRIIARKTSPNAASSGYGSGSGESDQELTSSIASSNGDTVISNVQTCSFYVPEPQRASRYQSRREREVEKWRRRSVPAAPRIPDDAVGILSQDGHIRLETNVDTGERIAMEVHGIRRPQSILELARRFGEIGAAQENDLHRSRTSLDGKENQRSSSGGAMSGRPNMFKQMEKVGPGTVGVPRQLSTNSIKDALLRWLQSKVQGYPHVNVTNFSSSWADGMAFCALIHHFAPHSFDFNKLDPSDRRRNLELAFKVSEDNGICQLLEVDDMISMGDRPDWKCVFTYLQQFYKAFRNRP